MKEQNVFSVIMLLFLLNIEGVLNQEEVFEINLMMIIIVFLVKQENFL